MARYRVEVTYKPLNANRKSEAENMFFSTASLAIDFAKRQQSKKNVLKVKYWGGVKE